MQPFKTENRKSRLNPCVKVLGRLIMGFYILKRIQENQRLYRAEMQKMA